MEGGLDFRARSAGLDSARMRSDSWRIGHTGLAVGAEEVTTRHHTQGKSAALQQGTQREEAGPQKRLVWIFAQEWEGHMRWMSWVYRWHSWSAQEAQEWRMQPGSPESLVRMYCLQDKNAVHSAQVRLWHRQAEHKRQAPEVRMN